MTKQEKIDKIIFRCLYFGHNRGFTTKCIHKFISKWSHYKLNEWIKAEQNRMEGK